MLRKLINWLSLSKVAYHKSQSDRAFSVFKKTLDDLSKSNECISVDIAEEERKMNLAIKTKEELNLVKESNEKFITKINNFFELN